MNKELLKKIEILEEQKKEKEKNKVFKIDFLEFLMIYKKEKDLLKLIKKDNIFTIIDNKLIIKSNSNIFNQYEIIENFYNKYNEYLFECFVNDFKIESDFIKVK